LKDWKVVDYQDSIPSLGGSPAYSAFRTGRLRGALTPQELAMMFGYGNLILVIEMTG